jgi:peptidoglycan/xylan/chitin deacetylase (PgdA/CDA1 family)
MHGAATTERWPAVAARGRGGPRALRRHAGAMARMRAARLSGRRAGLALVYHAVAPRAGDPRREFVPAISLAALSAQLRALRRHYRLVPASSLADAAEGRRRGERFPVALTFDDDLPSHLRLAAPALRAARAPATFFLTGSSLDAPHRFWWERLQHALDAGIPLDGLVPGEVLAAAGRDERGRWRPAPLSEAVQRLDVAAREALALRLEQRLGPDHPDAGLRAEEVRRLVRAGFEIGFHTLRHHPLSLVDDEALALALREGRDRLAAVAGTDLPAIAYPFGKTDARVAGAAMRDGYRAGFTVEPVAWRPGGERLLIGRLDPTSLSAAGAVRHVARALAEDRPVWPGTA